MTLIFDPAVLAEQRRHNAEGRNGSGKLDDPRALDLATIRRSRMYRRDGSSRHDRDPTAHDRDLPTELGPTRIRCFDSGASQGLAVHFHGGGWALGSIHAQDRLLREISRQTSLDVISIAYPLAPEVGLAEILAFSRAALTALIRSNVRRPIVMIGESAGAHLALSSLLEMRDHGEPIAGVRALSLFYGIYDLSMTPSQRAWGSEFLGLSTPWLEYFYELALPGVGPEARREPWISPLYASLADLPPTLLSVGTLDPLVDDSVLLGDRLHAAGNKGRLDVYPEAAHGFNHAATAMARHANRASCEFLSANL